MSAVLANNNAVVLGQETRTAAYENITVRDCDVLFCRDDMPVKAALAIVCLHTTDFRNILFEDIRVGLCGQLITAFYCDAIFRLRGSQNGPGEINGVTFRNITAGGPGGNASIKGSRAIWLEGWSESKRLRNVTLENIQIEGQPVTAASPLVLTNGHVSDLRIK